MGWHQLARRDAPRAHAEDGRGRAGDDLDLAPGAAVGHGPVHRPPPAARRAELRQVFRNNAKDLASIELEGDGADTIGEITGALDRGTKLVTVNMVPQHERDAVAIDTHVSMRV